VPSELLTTIFSGLGTVARSQGSSPFSPDLPTVIYLARRRQLVSSNTRDHTVPVLNPTKLSTSTCTFHLQQYLRDKSDRFRCQGRRYLHLTCGVSANFTLGNKLMLWTPRQLLWQTTSGLRASIPYPTVTLRLTRQTQMEQDHRPQR
jgi:hypothetical protein